MQTEQVKEALHKLGQASSLHPRLRTIGSSTKPRESPVRDHHSSSQGYPFLPTCPSNPLATPRSQFSCNGLHMGKTKARASSFLGASASYALRIYGLIRMEEIQFGPLAGFAHRRCRLPEKTAVSGHNHPSWMTKFTGFARTAEKRVDVSNFKKREAAEWDACLFPQHVQLLASLGHRRKFT